MNTLSWQTRMDGGGWWFEGYVFCRRSRGTNGIHTSILTINIHEMVGKHATDGYSVFGWGLIWCALLSIVCRQPSSYSQLAGFGFVKEHFQEQFQDSKLRTFLLFGSCISKISQNRGPNARCAQTGLFVFVIATRFDQLKKGGLNLEIQKRHVSSSTYVAAIWVSYTGAFPFHWF